MFQKTLSQGGVNSQKRGDVFCVQSKIPQKVVFLKKWGIIKENPPSKWGSIQEWGFMASQSKKMDTRKRERPN